MATKGYDPRYQTALSHLTGLVIYNQNFQTSAICVSSVTKLALILMESFASHVISELISPYDSIDDLLDKYKPTQSSIRECLAYLDDYSFIFTPCEGDWMVRESVLISAEKLCDPVDSISKAAPSPKFGSDQPCTVQRLTTDNGHPRPVTNACRCSKRRPPLSTKEKEDRRRDQNREAQRRFREKNLLVSTQGSYGMSIIHWRGRVSLLP